MLSRLDFTVFRKACWYTVSVKSGTNGDERISQVFSAWWRAAYEASLSLFCFSCQNLLLTRRMYQWLKSSITNALSLRRARCSSRPFILPVTSFSKLSLRELSNLSFVLTLYQTLLTDLESGLN